MQRSWIESANARDTDFSIANLPFGCIRRADTGARCATAIGDRVVDLTTLEEAGLIVTGAGRPVFASGTLNDFMAAGPATWRQVRSRLADLLADGGNSALRGDERLRARAILAATEVENVLPFRVAGYSDFNAARQHAYNAGAMLRGAENALPANWLHMPIGYNGRASTVVCSGTPIRRPLGQMRPQGLQDPVFGPSRRLDFELELGAVVGIATEMGRPLSVAEADRSIFGYVLLNDWSARDIQGWETQPLGPFQGKAFGTTISPWIVTTDALAPFRVAGPPREKPLLPYLAEPGPMVYDIALEAAILPADATAETTVTRTNARHLYYSAAQMIAHHAVGGCRMDVGDLIGTGTISGPERTAWASLLELTIAGREPLTLDGGIERRFLEDGDTVILRGVAARDGLRVGFGPCSGTILPAPAFPAA